MDPVTDKIPQAQIENLAIKIADLIRPQRLAGIFATGGAPAVGPLRRAAKRRKAGS